MDLLNRFAAITTPDLDGPNDPPSMTAILLDVGPPWRLPHSLGASMLGERRSVSIHFRLTMKTRGETNAHKLR